MKVLWITNIPIGKHCEVTNTSHLSGAWISSTLRLIKDEQTLEICIVTTWPIKEKVVINDKNIDYVLLPGGFPIKYKPDDQKNIEEWKLLIATFKPDIIQIWGTEFAHSLACIRHIKGIPIIVYMQGIMSQIARQYLASMSSKEIKNATSLRDILRKDSINQQQKKSFKRAEIEKEILLQSNAVIVENYWAETHCLALNPKLKIFKSQLAINEIFFNKHWVYDEIEENTIMCNASGYPIKGLHILINALNLVIRKYPNTKLFIPGQKSPFEMNWVETLKEAGYTKYIKLLIIKFGLKQNIVFLGFLSSGQMADFMAKVNVFVVPSSIENHSSTLIEAMTVGAPCIASYVGGIPEYLTHSENGFLYRFEEYEMLAQYICNVFADSDLASKLGNNAKNAIIKTRNSENIKGEIIAIYNEICASISLP
jgi:L-malate glycosyltransferase